MVIVDAVFRARRHGKLDVAPSGTAAPPTPLGYDCSSPATYPAPRDITPDHQQYGRLAVDALHASATWTPI